MLLLKNTPAFCAVIPQLIAGFVGKISMAHMWVICLALNAVTIAGIRLIAMLQRAYANVTSVVWLRSIIGRMEYARNAAENAPTARWIKNAYARNAAW